MHRPFALLAAFARTALAVYELEWWHFDYRDWKSFAMQNLRFEALASGK